MKTRLSCFDTISDGSTIEVVSLFLENLALLQVLT